VAIALLPLVFTDSYWRTNLIICALNVMLAIGLDFVLGYAGQLNLGSRPSSGWAPTCRRC
jgi:ABC-type branched-chain amino acid transport system, permease component